MGVIQFKGGSGSIQFKGGTGTIQFKNLGKVANPTISAYWTGGGGNILQRVSVTNNDTETATIYAGKITNVMPSYGDLAGGATTTITIFTTSQVPLEGTTFTAFVQMKATGRTNSDIVSDVSGGYFDVPQG